MKSTAHRQATGQNRKALKLQDENPGLSYKQDLDKVLSEAPPIDADELDLFAHLPEYDPDFNEDELFRDVE